MTENDQINFGEMTGMRVWNLREKIKYVIFAIVYFKSIVKMKSCIYSLFIAILLTACGGKKERDSFAIKQLAERHVSELKAPQLLREYLLSIDNDTIGLCYALVMPKPTLVRLMNEETYPTPGGLEKIRQSLVNRYSFGKEYVDSCMNDKVDDKDWLINNTINEPVNPIWEQLAYE